MGGEIQITDDLTLTAHWTANTYTVQYKGQSSYSFLPDTTYSTQLCTYDVPFTMPGRPQNAFVAGKTFAGWSYTRGAATPDFLPEQEDVVNLTDEDEGVVELWAVWRSSWPGGGGRFGMQSSTADPEPAVAFHTKTYTYDLAGNRTYFELSKDGETIQSVGYAYDTLNRLTAVTEGGVTQASYTYDVNGNRSGMTLANGVSTAYTYNAANWITSLTNTQNGNTLSSFDYAYYPSGNQASKTAQNGVVTTYEYDGLGRLTRESEQGGLTVNYAFDAAGNRASMAVTGTENYTVSYNYDANNRLISSTYTGSTTQSSYYTYDAAGNLLTAAEWRPQEAVASAANYGYNGFNQLATQTVNDVSSSFAYNASGIRTAKLTEGVLTGYLLDGGNVVAELEDDALSASYLRGANLISRTTNTTEYYTFNAHGDVVGLVSAAGTQTKAYDYDAFGNEKDRVGSDPNPFRYCGEYFDVESGAYYFRARYYDPSIGRFTQEDTAKDGLNWYSYTGGNPVLFIDPTGCQYVCVDDFGSGGQPVPQEDATQQLVTKEQLEEMGWTDVSDDFVAKLNSVLMRYGITNPDSILLFLITITVESNWGTSTLENGSDDYFAKKGYGKNKRGAGYMQITGEEIHREFLKSVNDDYTGDDTASYIAENYAIESAAWYWTSYKCTGEKNLNAYVSKHGSSEGIFLITQYFVNKYLPKNDYPHFDDDLASIRKGGAYSIQNGKLYVNGRSYDLPRGWEWRIMAYKMATKNF